MDGSALLNDGPSEEFAPSERDDGVGRTGSLAGLQLLEGDGSKSISIRADVYQMIGGSEQPVNIWGTPSRHTDVSVRAELCKIAEPCSLSGGFGWVKSGVNSPTEGPDLRGLTPPVTGGGSLSATPGIAHEASHRYPLWTGMSMELVPDSPSQDSSQRSSSLVEYGACSENENTEQAPLQIEGLQSRSPSPAANPKPPLDDQKEEQGGVYPATMVATTAGGITDDERAIILAAAVELGDSWEHQAPASPPDSDTSPPGSMHSAQSDPYLQPVERLELARAYQRQIELERERERERDTLYTIPSIPEETEGDLSPTLAPSVDISPRGPTYRAPQAPPNPPQLPPHTPPTHRSVSPAPDFFGNWEVLETHVRC